jgi:hypothetical protein
MTGDEGGRPWLEPIARRRPMARDAEDLAKLVDEDHDPAEESYYEALADPDAQRLDDAQRSHAGQHLRRLRRLRNSASHERRYPGR